MGKKKENGLFDGLFTGIEKLVDLATKLKEGEVKTEKQEEEQGIDLSHIKNGRGIFGFSIKTLAGGKPIVETFGNIKKTSKGAAIKKERKPIIDVFDEKDEIKIYVEIPGVDKDDIKINVRGTSLDISAQHGDRIYQEEVLLPSGTNLEPPRSNYKNGILEIRIKKVQE